MRQRIEHIVLGGVGVIGQVDHPDILTVGVTVLHDPVDRRDHL